MSIVSNNFDEAEFDLTTDMEFTKMKDDEKVHGRRRAAPNACAHESGVRDADERSPQPGVAPLAGRFFPFDGSSQVGLANGMANNTKITVLKLNKVLIKDSFAEAMGKSLATNKTLETLSLESNQITSVGIIALANGLKDNKTLLELKLHGQSATASTEAENVRASRPRWPGRCTGHRAR